MKEDIKLPAIIDNVGYNQKVLIFKCGKAYHLEGDHKGAWSKGEYCIESQCKNITREYLANTYGKVESKEHAEFIVELVDGVDFINPTGSSFDGCPCWFCFDDNELYFFDDEHNANDCNEKLITIPLPPKQVVIGEKKSEVYMPELNAVSSGFVVASGELLNYKVIGNGDFDNALSTITVAETKKAKDSDLNSSYFFPDAPYGGSIGDGGAYLVGGDSSNTNSNQKTADLDEWPRVGDEVLIDISDYDVVYGQNIDGLICKVLSIFKDGDTTVYAVNRDGVNYCFVRDLLQKPKTPEEQLLDEMESEIRRFSINPDSLRGRQRDAARELIEKLNITKSKGGL